MNNKLWENESKSGECELFQYQDRNSYVHIPWGAFYFKLKTLDSHNLFNTCKIIKLLNDLYS